MFKVSLSNELKLSVKTGCDGHKVKYIDCDLRVFVQNGELATRRGISFKMDELKEMVALKMCIMSIGAFHHENKGRMLDIKPFESGHLISLKKVNVPHGQYLRLRTNELEEFLSLIPSCIFVMENYGKRVETLAVKVKTSLIASLRADCHIYPVEDMKAKMAWDSEESELAYRSARAYLALGIPNALLSLDESAGEADPIIFSLSSNEMINF